MHRLWQAEAGANVRAITHHRPLNEFTKLNDVVDTDLMDAQQTAKVIRVAEIFVHAAGIT